MSAVEAFRDAVNSRDAMAVRRVLSEHAEARAAINDAMFGFDSPAIVAVAGSGDLALVDALLEFGADPNRKSDWWAGGFHALYSARGKVAARLLEAGAVPDACAAAHLDRPELLAAMLREDPARVHERGGDGQMPLHFARSRQAVDLLLAAGADPDARDVDHRSTAAEWMIGDRDRRQLALYLVQLGASADIFLAAALGLTQRAVSLLASDPRSVQARTSQGAYGEQPPGSYHIYTWTLGPNLTPLQVAARFGRAETLDAMLPFAPAEERLVLAGHMGDREAALAIVRDNPEVMARLAPSQRRALTEAAWAANTPAVELLLELGFDPAAPMESGPAGATALHCAAWEGSVGCVAAILRYAAGRALLEVRDPVHRGTPLGWAGHGSVNCGSPRADHARVAELLIEAGAVVDRSLLEGGASEAFRRVIAKRLAD